jgi:benzoyl-CoA reductase/2-hydroxyglutaryl-CoA dehydratase subunit BcrC/BadD/HgdB
VIEIKEDDAYRKYLQLANFEKDEIAGYLPEWRKASKKLGLTLADMKFATEHWIPENFEVELEGVRKVLRAYTLEVLDLVKANEYKKKGVKIVYGILPASLVFYYALKLEAPDKVYVSFPDAFLTHLLASFFHKVVPFLEEAEQHGIPYGGRHCALNKMRYAARRSGLIPSPDVSWIWGFVCDEGPKTDEFIREYYDPEWKTVITRIPHDQPFGTREDEIDERVEYLAKQMEDGFKTVQRTIGVEVQEDTINKIIDRRTEYAKKLGKLYKLMTSDPQPLSGNDGVYPADPLMLAYNTFIDTMDDALDTLIKDVEHRVNKCEGILPEGAPKLMGFIIPVCNPWLVKMFEKNDVGFPYYEGMVPSKKEMKLPRFKDAYMGTAETWLKWGHGVNIGYKAEVTLEKLQTYEIDGMVFGFMDFDRWLGSDHRLLCKIVEKESKVPTFYIEADAWEDRDYSPEALRTRIDTISEIVKMQKKRQ